jgi:hypothetical protein
VAVGHVVQLSKTALYQGTELFGVASVSGSTLTLKRTGISTLAGLPPAFSSQTGITFTITTLAEQIAKASYDLNQQFGIDDMITGRRAVDMYDPTEVRDVTVFLVAFQQYEQMARSAGEASDHFAAMAKVYQQHYLDRLSRAEVHWKLTAVISESNRFTARIVR